MMEMVMPAATPTLTTMTSTMATTTAMMVAPPCWSVGAFGSVRMSGAAKMAKMHRVKPVVERILRGSGLKDHADLLRAVVDHPMMAAARELAGFDSSKEKVTAEYLSGQSAWMMGRARAGGNPQKARGNTTREK